MWYDKKKKRFHSRLPRKGPGVTNFHKLSPADLHGHGFVEVTDARPAFDPETQRLVKGKFNEATALQQWVVEPIPVIEPGPKHLGQAEIVGLFQDVVKITGTKKRNEFLEKLAEYEQELPETPPDNASTGSLSL